MSLAEANEIAMFVYRVVGAVSMVIVGRAAWVFIKYVEKIG